MIVLAAAALWTATVLDKATNKTTVVPVTPGEVKLAIPGQNCLIDAAEKGVRYIRCGGSYSGAGCDPHGDSTSLSVADHVITLTCEPRVAPKPLPNVQKAFAGVAYRARDDAGIGLYFQTIRLEDKDFVIGGVGDNADDVFAVTKAADGHLELRHRALYPPGEGCALQLFTRKMRAEVATQIEIAVGPDCPNFPFLRDTWIARGLDDAAPQCPVAAIRAACAGELGKCQDAYSSLAAQSKDDDCRTRLFDVLFTHEQTAFRDLPQLDFDAVGAVHTTDKAAGKTYLRWQPEWLVKKFGDLLPLAWRRHLTKGSTWKELLAASTHHAEWLDLARLGDPYDYPYVLLAEQKTPPSGKPLVPIKWDEPMCQCSGKADSGKVDPRALENGLRFLGGTVGRLDSPYSTFDMYWYDWSKKKSVPSGPAVEIIYKRDAAIVAAHVKELETLVLPKGTVWDDLRAYELRKAYAEAWRRDAVFAYLLRGETNLFRAPFRGQAIPERCLAEVKDLEATTDRLAALEKVSRWELCVILDVRDAAVATDPGTDAARVGQSLVIDAKCECVDD
jgi:hypothetical protein